ncbi:hypothetical protein RFI_31537 [Reticulomyxa filosa]|uniref:Uncharacterized protein n=1 Tax=Reticulomyxa filosa TaxID=46433 RepID=X6LYS8_RETFI|nr:hypothetical protein RFI_31537 [Reticulomyxa filosa]|eukprot:ETO05860.1 hypothetical protein RFI_31537 [Reticulomyxa filosa]
MPKLGDFVVDVPSAIIAQGRSDFAQLGEQYNSVDLFVIEISGDMAEPLMGVVISPLFKQKSILRYLIYSKLLLANIHIYVYMYMYDITEKMNTPVLFIALDMDASTNDFGKQDTTWELPLRSSLMSCTKGDFGLKQYNALYNNISQTTSISLIHNDDGNIEYIFAQMCGFCPYEQRSYKRFLGHQRMQAEYFQRQTKYTQIQL